MYENKTQESIKQEILAGITNDIDKREGSYTNDIISPVSTELWKLYSSMNGLLPIVFVDETSGEYIDKRCAEYGITRKLGTKAHATLTLTGTAGITVPAKTVFLTEDGLGYATQAETIIPGTVEVEAENTGTKYNAAENTIIRQTQNTPGLTGIKNTAAVGGTDIESDKNLYDRLKLRLQKPATSGNKHHYEQWALETSGVGAVKVMPIWNGAGTVKVLIASPAKQPVDNTIVQACTDYIESVKPIGATVTVTSASALAVNVNASITIDRSTTKQDVQKIMSARLEEYLKLIAFEKYELIYNRIVAMLLDIPGVIDFSMLTVNGGTVNVDIGADAVPVLGTVTMS